MRHFLDRRSSSGNKPKHALANLSSSVAQGTANVDQTKAEADDLKDFIEKDVLCVDFAIKGQPALDSKLTNGNHVWTPVQVKKPKSLSDEPVA